MKKTIPFTKEISFKTKIAEITDIEVTHDLEKTPFNTIEGNFLVDGKYKMHEASQIEEDFSYELPFTIEVDEKYDITDANIKISDFYFEIVNEDILKVNIEVELSNVSEKKDLVFERCYDDEDEEEDEDEDDIQPLENIVEPIDILEVPQQKKLEVNTDFENQEILDEEVDSRPITDIFTSINNDEDTFKTYHVYIVRENDTLDAILEKYNVTKEDLSEYNDLNDIKIGTKLILPCSTYE